MEYALEAIKQGSAVVGLTNNSYAVLVALKRNAEELGSYQKKIIKVDDHMGIALAGLAPDARVLSNYLREQAMSQRMVFDRPLSVQKAATLLADKAQKNTQSYGGRPYGVGLLVIGYDETGAHLYEFQPSGSSLEYYGAAIGARSQAGRTYLERNLETYNNKEVSLEDLITHGLTALRDTLPQDKELTLKNTSIAVVGKDLEFTQYDDDDVKQWLDKLDSLGNKRDSGDAEAEAGQSGESGEAGEASEPAVDADADVPME